MDEFDFVSDSNEDFKRIHYKLQYCPLASRKAGRDVYSGAVIKKETCGTVQLAKRLASQNPLIKESHIRMLISDLANLIGDLVSEGRAVNIGGVVRFMPVIHGTFDSPDEPWNPEKHKVLVNACVGSRMRKILEKSAVSRIGGTSSPELLQVLNPEMRSVGSISSGGKFMVTGSRLVWNPEAEDEGWFINLGGAESKCEVVKMKEPFDLAVLRCTQTFETPDTPILLIFRTRPDGKVLHQIAFNGPLVTA